MKGLFKIFGYASILGYGFLNWLLMAPIVHFFMGGATPFFIAGIITALIILVAIIFMDYLIKTHVKSFAVDYIKALKEDNDERKLQEDNHLGEYVTIPRVGQNSSIPLNAQAILSNLSQKYWGYLGK